MKNSLRHKPRTRLLRTWSLLLLLAASLLVAAGACRSPKSKYGPPEAAYQPMHTLY